MKRINIVIYVLLLMSNYSLATETFKMHLDILKHEYSLNLNSKHPSFIHINKYTRRYLSENSHKHVDLIIPLLSKEQDIIYPNGYCPHVIIYLKRNETLFKYSKSQGNKFTQDSYSNEEAKVWLKLLEKWKTINPSSSTTQP